MKHYKFACGCRWPVLEERPDGELPLLDFDFEKIPLDCKATWELLGKGLVKGVFQLESPLGKRQCKILKPESIEHMGALGAILRPGSLRAVDSEGVSITEHYCRRKNKEEEVTPYHPAVDPILVKSYNQMIFQEQAILIARAVAGFTLTDADTLRKACGKKLASEMAKVKKMFLDGAAKAQVVPQAMAEELFSWIEKSQRYSFNACTHKDTLIRKHGGNADCWRSVEEMYHIRNDIEYAKATGHEELRKKWKRLGHYGWGLSLNTDGRIRNNIIRDIQPSGKQLVYKITLKNGSSIRVTGSHKFPTNLGELTVDAILSISQTVELFVCGEYEKTTKKYCFSNWTNEDRAKRTGKSGFKTHGEENRWYTNGSYSDFVHANEVLERICVKCNKVNCRFELHHKDGDRSNSKLDNLERLCVSCHKKAEYKLGRAKRGEKGYPSYLCPIVSIEPDGVVDTYDVTMDGPNHNFVVDSGIVTCNSHAMCYGIRGYKTAYAKAHAPLVFFAAWLKNAKQKPDPKQEAYELVNEARLFDITIEPPLLTSLERSVSLKGRSIYLGLGDIKGLGEAQVSKLEKIIHEAEDRLNRKLGEFSWYDFLCHCAPSITSNVLTALIKVGALRTIAAGRSLPLSEYSAVAELTKTEVGWLQNNANKFDSIIPAMKAMARPRKEGGGCANKNRVSIVQSLAMLLENPPSRQADTPAWVAYNEEELLGISLTCSKIDSCDTSAVNAGCKDFLSGMEGFMVFGVVINSVREVVTKKGKNAGAKMAFLSVSDSSCSMDVVCFPEAWKEYSHLLKEGNTIILQGERSNSDSLSVTKVWEALQV